MFAFKPAVFNSAKRVGPQLIRSMATVTAIKAKTTILVLSGVAVAAIVLAPAEEFDDLDCMNHVHIYDENHPCNQAGK